MKECVFHHLDNLTPTLLTPKLPMTMHGNIRRH